MGATNMTSVRPYTCTCKKRVATRKKWRARTLSAGSQVSAVSAKTNTTRTETLGVVTRGDAQLVLLDLPGIVGPEHYRNSTHATKVGGAWASAVGSQNHLGQPPVQA